MEVWDIEGETPEEGEWPKRDAVPLICSNVDGEFTRASSVPIGLRPAEVTPEMRRIGGDILRKCREMEVFHEQAAEAAFQAMHAVAPVPLVSDAEIALTRERDEARARAKFQGEQGLQWAVKYGETLEELNALRVELAKATARNAVLERTIADYADADAARINAAGLAALQAQPAAAPDPIANAIRTHGADRRMVGR